MLNKNKWLEKELNVLNKTERMASYKLNTILKHLNMSTFDYDIAKDTIYLRKDMMLLTDFTTNWFEENEEYYYLENVTERLTDIIRESFIGKAIEMMEQIRENTSGEMIPVDVPIVYPGGNTRWTNFVFDTILDEEGRPEYAIGYCKDIHTEKKELFRLRNVARTDSLTGFHNRAAGMSKIEHGIRELENSMGFVAVIDLDKFKNANDLFGHTFGDFILKNVADSIREYVDSETICCRTGGDEFLCFRKCDNEEQAMEFFSGLKEHLRHTVSYQGSEFDVDASIGFSLFPLQGAELEELYNKADIAMYHAKNARSNVPWIYNDSMEEIRK